MHANGVDRYAQLAAELAELRAAHALLCRRVADELVGRLLDLERTADLVLELIRAGGAAADELVRDPTHNRRAIERAREEENPDGADGS
jgi:hypothetical protein